MLRSGVLAHTKRNRKTRRRNGDRPHRVSTKRGSTVSPVSAYHVTASTTKLTYQTLTQSYLPSFVTHAVLTASWAKTPWKLKALWEVELYILQPHSQVCLSHYWWSRSFAWATAKAEPVLYCNLKASISHILRAPLPQTLFSVWQQAAFIFGNSFTLLLVCKLYFFTADNGRNLGPRNTI